MVQLLDGNVEAEKLSKKFQNHLQELKISTGLVPTLAVLLVGDNPSSQLYVRRKQEKALSLGINVCLHQFPKNISQEKLQAVIQGLNLDPKVHGILLQLPLPTSLDTVSALSQISPFKDVDGLHPENLGLLLLNKPRFIPCTPQGCLHLIHLWKKNLQGLTAVVIGRSPLVGNPIARLLLNQDATVIQAHSQTSNLPDLCKIADLLIVAIGKPNFIPGSWIKLGACLIDVGINSLAPNQITGDIDFKSASKVASALSPVPGGVGPLTIMFLMSNVIKAAHMQVEG